MQPLEVQLFGGLELRHAGERLPPMPARAARSLFAYLVLHRRSQHPRERLAELFWPDVAPSRARRRLSHTLWQVQDLLSELPGTAEVLSVRTDTIGIDPDAQLRVDVEEFDRRLEALRARRTSGQTTARDLVDLEGVIELYRGELLDGYHDAWAIDAQERYHQRYLEALTWLIRSATSQGLYPDALLYARRLANLDPLREDAHREVMRLCMLLGRPGDALRQFERCRAVLAEELGAPPAAATVELHERILRQRPPLDATTAPPQTAVFPDRFPLLGREQERGAVVQLLERALAGRGGVAFVEAEAGGGKSRLLAEVADDARWRGFDVLVTSCLGPEPGRPYAAIADLLTHGLTPVRIEQVHHRVAPVWLSEVARLAPRLATAPGRRAPADPIPAPAPVVPAHLGSQQHTERQQRLQDAVVEVFLALSASEPVLVVVDDVHWADEATVRVLRRIAERTRRSRVVIVCAFRGDEVRARDDHWHELRELDRAAQPTRVTLSALDRFSTGELLRIAVAGRRSGDIDLAQLYADTGGNPLFVVETLRELVEQGGAVHPPDGTGTGGEAASTLPIPERIRTLLLTRLTRLPPEARQVAEVVALAREGSDLELICATTDLPRVVVIDMVDLLLRRSVLRDAGEGYAIHHDQLRRVAIDALAPATRQAWHRRLADAMRDGTPDDAEGIAHHLVEAGEASRAVPWLVTVAARAMDVHAYELADRGLQRARDCLQRVPTTTDQRIQVLLLHAELLDVLGEPDRLDRTLDELAPLTAADPGRCVDVDRRRAQRLARLGDLPEAIALATATLTRAEAHGDAELLADVLVVLGTALTWAGEADRAAQVLRRAAATSTSIRVRLAVRCNLGTVLREVQRYDEAAAELEAALDLAHRSGDPRAQAQVCGVLGAVEMETGDLQRAGELFEQAIEHCVATGERGAEQRNRLNLANLQVAQDRYAEALAGYETARQGFQLVADRRGLALAHLNLANLRHAVLGDDASAEQDLRVVLDYADEVGAELPRAVALDLLARIQVRRGGFARAAASLDDGIAAAAAARSVLARVHLLQARCEWVLAHREHQAATPARWTLDDARADATEAVAATFEHGLRDLQADALAMLARVLLAAGDAAAAWSVAGRLAAVIDRDQRAAFGPRYVLAQATAAIGDLDAATQAHTSLRRELGAALTALPEELQASAARVPVHAAILAGNLPGTVVIEVADATAPSGRPLGAEERIEVTIGTHPQPDDPTDPIERRRVLLRRMAARISEQGGAATVGDLASLLGVSEATVRRDLRACRHAGEVVTTRGARSG